MPAVVDSLFRLGPDSVLFDDAVQNDFIVQVKAEPFDAFVILKLGQISKSGQFFRSLGKCLPRGIYAENGQFLYIVVQPGRHGFHLRRVAVPLNQFVQLLNLYILLRRHVVALEYGIGKTVFAR